MNTDTSTPLAQVMAKRLAQLCEDEDDGMGLEVLGVRAWDASKPLLVVVHPGDMTEVDAPAEVVEYSMTYQGWLAATMAQWQGDIAVLHRFSSLEFVERSRRAKESLTVQMDRAMEQAVMIAYGDDLAAFAKQLAEIVEGRPKVVVAGAYRHARHGCVDFVARKLKAQEAKVEIHPSAYREP